MAADGAGRRPHRPTSVWGRVRRWWTTYHWWVAVLLGLLALVLGIVGFGAALDGAGLSRWDLLYLSLQLFALESGSAVTGDAPVALHVARLLAPALAAYGIGAVLASFFRDELLGLRARMLRDHIVVCGLETGWAAVDQLRAAGWRVVVVERDPQHPGVEPCRLLNVPVLVGDPRDEVLLRKAGVLRAARLVAVSGDDAVNLKLAETARRIARRRTDVRLRRPTAPLRILVHTADPRLAELLTMQELEGASEPTVHLDFFSMHTGAARAVLSRYAAVVRGGADPPHLVVIGLGRLGQQLVVQAARNWHLDHPDDDQRCRITVVDEDPSDRLDALLQRNPLVATVCDVAAVRLPADPLRLVHAALLEDALGASVSVVFVCVDDDAAAIGIGLALREELAHRELPVVVRVHDRDTAALVPSATDPTAPGLHVFDQVAHVCRPEVLFAGVQERLAQAMHETYMRHQLAVGDTPADNPSMVPWEQLEEHKRESNRDQAAHISNKLTEVGCELGPMSDPTAEEFAFAPEEVELLSRMEHDRWRTTAPPDHPQQVSWEELSEEMRDVDREFVRLLPALVATVGLQVNRL